jgi:hypothetical protein
LDLPDQKTAKAIIDAFYGSLPLSDCRCRLLKAGSASYEKVICILKSKADDIYEESHLGSPVARKEGIEIQGESRVRIRRKFHFFGCFGTCTETRGNGLGF